MLQFTENGIRQTSNGQDKNWSIGELLEAFEPLREEPFANRREAMLRVAEMAESLIYLTYLKRRITFAEESVGGPVDVAIISKGDGFIWKKRKHYFKPELNPHFFSTYLR